LEAWNWTKKDKKKLSQLELIWVMRGESYKIQSPANQTLNDEINKKKSINEKNKKNNN